jgi:predicted acyltransferase
MRWQNDALNFIHWVNPKNPESGVRILGVLQRIAICYFFASLLVYYLKPRVAFFVGLILLLLYWAICYVANPEDPFSLEGWFGTAIDKQILNVPHMYKGEGMPFDPEGLMSVMPAIVQVMFGYFVGDYIVKKGKTFEMITGLFVASVAMIVTGFCWDTVFPINKKIWTSSYTIYTTGLATMTLATMIYIIEFRNVKGFVTRFFDVFGKNALFVFALSAFLPKGLALARIPYTNAKGEEVFTTPWRWLYDRVLIKIPGPPENGSLIYALCVITFMWLICYWMDKRKIYIKV